MMTLILHHILYKKKCIAIGTLILLYICFLIIIGFTSDTALDRLLYPIETAQYYDIISEQMMGFVATALLATIAFDFNATYDRPLYAYFGKTRVIMCKLLLYIILIICCFFLLNVLRIGLATFIFTYSDVQKIMVSFYKVFDLIILFGWMLALTPQKFKQASFLIIMVYVLMTMIQEDLVSINIFYIAPFYHAILSAYSHSFYYTILYIIGLIMIVYVKEFKKAY